MSQTISEIETDHAVTSATARVQRVKEVFQALRREIHRVFVGQQELVDMVLSALLADGHVLIEGVPGLGKTLLVRSLAAALDLPFSRIQFTPDLMPADITGTNVLVETAGGGHELRFEPGPLLSNIVLADEINRATPRTQSALLEAMQERQISVGRRTLALPEPFIVLATQNPVEQEGTYPLPEAQLDRFMVKLLAQYPTEDEYHQVLQLTTDQVKNTIEPVCGGEDILELRSIVRGVVVSSQVRTYAIRIVMATQPASPQAPEVIRNNVVLGASPRAAQSLILLGKVRALLAGRFAVSCKDICDVALPVLRHRIVPKLSTRADRFGADELARSAVSSVSELSETL